MNTCSMQISLTVPDDLCPRLQAAAAASGQTEADFIISTLKSKLKPIAPKKLSSKKIHLTTPVVGLVEGLLFGDTTVGEALQYGNFGLGTLNGLEGEVIILDGEPYLQAADQQCVVAPRSALTPFMCTTSFDRQLATCLELPHPLELADLQSTLQQEFPSANIFYAILVEGQFSSIKIRVVRKQEKPRPLLAVAKEQFVYEFKDVSGSLLGFWSPQYFGSSLTVPGFHLHFLSTDKQHGGHVVDVLMQQGTAYIQPVYHAEMDIPKSLEFLQADLTKDPAKDLQEAE